MEPRPLAALSRFATGWARALEDSGIRQMANDNALAKTVIGLFKTEVAKRLGPWKTTGQFEWETMKRVHWYIERRRHGAIICQTPNERECAFPQAIEQA